MLPPAHGVLQDLKCVDFEAKDASFGHFSLPEELYHHRTLVQSKQDLRDLCRVAQCYSRHGVRGRDGTGRSRRLDTHDLAHSFTRFYIQCRSKLINSSIWHPQGTCPYTIRPWYASNAPSLHTQAFLHWSVSVC